jgi:hypothetical protein
MRGVESKVSNSSHELMTRGRRSDFTEVPLNQSATDPPVISETSEVAQATVLAPVLLSLDLPTG